MVAFPELERPTDWLNFIGPRAGRKSGLQGAHLFADDKWTGTNRFAFLKRLGNGVDANATGNGTTIRAESFYARSDGTTGALGEREGKRNHECEAGLKAEAANDNEYVQIRGVA